MTKVALGLRMWVAACVRKLKHAYVGTFLRTLLGFQEHEKGKFSTITTEVWNKSHIVWEPFQPHFFYYKNPYMVHF